MRAMGRFFFEMAHCDIHKDVPGLGELLTPNISFINIVNADWKCPNNPNVFRAK